jgi:hypothetical protein
MSSHTLHCHKAVQTLHSCKQEARKLNIHFAAAPVPPLTQQRQPISYKTTLLGDVMYAATL